MKSKVVVALVLAVGLGGCAPHMFAKPDGSLDTSGDRYDCIRAGQEAQRSHIDKAGAFGGGLGVAVYQLTLGAEERDRREKVLRETFIGCMKERGYTTQLQEIPY